MEEEAEPRGIDRTSRIAGPAALAFAAIAIATALSFRWPPMNDGSSHAATAAILAGLAAGDPFFSAHYSFDAVPLPYWLPTLLMAPLVPVFGAIGALRLLAAVILALTAFAGWRLLRDRAPENLVFAPLASLAGFHHAYFLGEVAFALGIPLSLLAFDALLRAPRIRSGAFLAFSALALATALSHLFALAALGLAAGAAWLGRFGASVPRERRRVLDAGLAATAALSLQALWLVTAAHGTGANRGNLDFDLSLGHASLLATWPLGPAAGGSPWPALAVVALAAAALAASLRRGAATALALPAALLAAVAVLGPAGLEEPYGYEDIGERFTLPALLLGLGAVRLRPSFRLRAVLLAAVVAFGALRTADVVRVHARHQEASAPLERLLARLPEGSRLLPLYDVRDEDPEDWLVHRFANWVVPLRHGYSPHVFARTGQQPLRHRLFGDHRRVEDLVVSEREWAFYDHVLVQSDAPGRPRVPGLAERASEIDRAGAFSLWRVAR